MLPSDCPRAFDLVTTFDVIHDAVDPRGLLRSIRKSLKKDGKYLCLDINCSPKLEQNVGALGSLFYGCSVLYCMTTSLAHGGEALGTCGLHEPKLKELSAEAGFAQPSPRSTREPVQHPVRAPRVGRRDLSIERDVSYRPGIDPTKCRCACPVHRKTGTCRRHPCSP